MVICNSPLLLKSLPINVINCIKFDRVNCSALTGALDWQYKYLIVCLFVMYTDFVDTNTINLYV